MTENNIVTNKINFSKIKERRLAGSLGLIVGVLIFILTFIYFSINAPGFLTRINLIKNLLMPASIAIVISLGMNFVMTAGGIDLSISSIAGLAGLASAAISVVLKLPFGFMLTGALLVGLLIGVLNGFLIAYGGISPFVVTLSMVFLVQGLQYLISLATVSGTYLMLPRAMTRLGSQPWFVIGICATLSVVQYIFIDWTVHGRYIKSVGKNVEASRFSGIPTRFYYGLTFVLSGLYCAVGGVMLTFAEGAAKVGSGESYLIDAFLIPILGKTIFGRFSALGTIFGAVFMYMLINGMFILGTPPEYVRLIKGGLLLAIILASGLQNILSGGNDE